jgi:hypothetical protein
MEYLGALGACSKCRQYKISVNGEAKCINCDSNNNTGSGMVVTIEDPGEDALNSILTKTGIKTTKTEANTAVIAPKTEAKAIVSFEDSIKQAIHILQNVTMPKDIQSFKAVAKTITILQKLLGE